jgi:hypothetical protein
MEDWMREARLRLATNKDSVIALTVRWREKGGTWQSAGEDLIVKNPGSAGVRNLIDTIRTALTAVAGQEPDGQAKVWMFEQGHAAQPIGTYQRTIRSDPEGDQDRFSVSIIKELRGELSELREHNRNIVGDLRDTVHHTLASLDKANEMIAHLSTHRVVGTTGADAGSSVWSIMALVGLAVGWPLVKESFGVPKSATLPETVQLVQARLKALVDKTRAGDTPTADVPPPPTHRQLEDQLGELDQPAPPERDAIVAAISTVLAEASTDAGALPRALAELGAGLEANPKLAIEIMTKFPWMLEIAQTVKAKMKTQQTG